MSRYSVTVPACVVQQAFAGIDVALPLQGDDVYLHFGYDGPLAVYFLDVEDAEEYHEFGYGARGFVPGKRLTKGQMLDVLTGILKVKDEEDLMMFHYALNMDIDPAMVM